MAAGAADLNGYGTPRRRSLAWGSRSLRMGSELHILALLPVLSLLAVQARCKGGGVRGHTPAAIKPLLPRLSLREGLTPSNRKPKQTFASLSNTPVCSFGRSKKSKEYRACWSDRGWCLVGRVWQWEASFTPSVSEVTKAAKAFGLVILQRLHLFYGPVQCPQSIRPSSACPSHPVLRAPFLFVSCPVRSV